jgi:hypothetical protein
VGFYVVICLLGLRESRREKVEREKHAAEKLSQYQRAFRERMKKILNPPFFQGRV